MIPFNDDVSSVSYSTHVLLLINPGSRWTPDVPRKDSSGTPDANRAPLWEIKRAPHYTHICKVHSQYSFLIHRS